MLSDFKIISHKFPNRQDIEIWPIADVHLGAAEHDAEAWGAFCKALTQKENAYVTIVGDLINNATRSSVSNIFQETLRPREQKKLMVQMLEPIRDKILSVVSGNHERRSGKDADDDPTYDICCKLDIETLYRENISFTKLHFGEDHIAGDRNPTYVITTTHGAGSGALTGGVVNKAERFAYVLDGADALIVAHSHKPFITAPSKIKIDPQHNNVYFRPFYVVNATSWMNYGGYAVQKMMAPTSIKPQIIRLCGKKKLMEVTM